MLNYKQSCSSQLVRWYLTCFYFKFICMNKLQRYKRNKVKHLQKYTNVILKMFPADSPSLKGIYSGYTEILFTIKITKRLPQKQYTTNLDVCNID